MGLWKNIRGGWDNFSLFIRFAVGYISKKFSGIICGMMRLLLKRNLSLFLIARNKEPKVADYWEYKNGFFFFFLEFVIHYRVA